MPRTSFRVRQDCPLTQPAFWIHRAFSVVALVVMAHSTRADRVELIPSADTTLIEVAPDSNLGGACIVNTGTTQINTRNHGLFLFDLTGTVPANAIVTSVELILGVTGEPANGFHDNDPAMLPRADLEGHTRGLL